jgi:hypothetical protein
MHDAGVGVVRRAFEIRVSSPKLQARLRVMGASRFKT